LSVRRWVDRKAEMTALMLATWLECQRVWWKELRWALQWATPMERHWGDLLAVRSAWQKAGSKGASTEYHWEQ
jgi:hypothetical protein